MIRPNAKHVFQKVRRPKITRPSLTPKISRPSSQKVRRPNGFCHKNGKDYKTEFTSYDVLTIKKHLNQLRHSITKLGLIICWL